MNRFVIIITLLCFSFAFLRCSKDAEKPRDEESTNPPDVIDIIETARIYPDPAYGTNRLEVRFEVDTWAELPEFSYAWKRNGRIIPGASESSLDPENFSKGDRITVEVSALDKAPLPIEFSTPEIIIRNTPPKIIEASLALETRETPNIFINAKCLDVDDDRIIYSYRWFRNGEIIVDHIDAMLDPSVGKRGDEIYTEIIASDGESSSNPFKTGPIEIQNHAPRVVSSPPSSTAEGKFIYQVLCEDTDGDAIAFELLTAPPGMSIDKNGKIEWLVPTGEERKEAYDIEIKVNDAYGGEFIQKFTFAIAPPDTNQ